MNTEERNKWAKLKYAVSVACDACLHVTSTDSHTAELAHAAPEVLTHVGESQQVLVPDQLTRLLGVVALNP